MLSVATPSAPRPMKVKKNPSPVRAKVYTVRPENETRGTGQNELNFNASFQGLKRKRQQQHVPQLNGVGNPKGFASLVTEFEVDMGDGADRSFEQSGGSFEFEDSEGYDASTEDNGESGAKRRRLYSAYDAHATNMWI